MSLLAVQCGGALPAPLSGRHEIGKKLKGRDRLDALERAALFSGYKSDAPTCIPLHGKLDHFPCRRKITGIGRNCSTCFNKVVPLLGPHGGMYAGEVHIHQNQQAIHRLFLYGHSFARTWTAFTS